MKSKTLLLPPNLSSVIGEITEKMKSSGAAYSNYLCFDFSFCIQCLSTGLLESRHLVFNKIGMTAIHIDIQQQDR